MKTLIFTKSGGSFMKSIVMAGAVVLLGLGATGAALADNAVELVSGNDIIYFDGTTSTLTCSISGVTAGACATLGVGTPTSTPAFGGGVTDAITASNFNGWNVTDSGTSYAPSCNVSGTCEDQNNLSGQGGTAALQAYFATSGFTTNPALGFMASGTSPDTGTVTATAYAYQPSGTLGLSGTSAPVGLGTPFSTLLLPGGEGLLSGTGTAPGNPYNLATAFSVPAGTTGSEVNLTETITTSVPESSSVSVLLAMLLGIAFVVRRGIAFNRM